MTTNSEAPASQSIKLSYKGFEVLVTQRDLEVKMQPYLLQAKQLIDGALELGFEVPPQRSWNAPKKEIKYVEGISCPECGSRVIEKTTKTGKTFQECENRKYDFTTKKDLGTCGYIKWS